MLGVTIPQRAALRDPPDKRLFSGFGVGLLFRASPEEAHNAFPEESDGKEAAKHSGNNSLE